MYQQNLSSKRICVHDGPFSPGLRLISYEIQCSRWLGRVGVWTLAKTSNTDRLSEAFPHFHTQIAQPKSQEGKKQHGGSESEHHVGKTTSNVDRPESHTRDSDRGGSAIDLEGKYVLYNVL